jgi:hypothetical protein
VRRPFRRLFVLLALGALASLLTVAPVAAASTPPISGTVALVELCPQSICGVAYFTGGFSGTIGSKSATGTLSVAVTHDPLPAPGTSSPITGGSWELQVSGHRYRGGVTSGTLFNNGNNTFTVQAVLKLTQGGSGPLAVTGLLNHNTFPPTLTGTVS